MGVGEERVVDTGDALADALMFSTVAVAGLDENGWVIRGIRLAPEYRERPGSIPNGVVMFERQSWPVEGRRWGTARWDVQGSGRIAFFTGEYDLTREEAEKDFNKRGID